MAVTALLMSVVIVHELVPEQPPPEHPRKLKFFPTVALGVTIMPLAWASEQSALHWMREGVLVTVAAIR